MLRLFLKITALVLLLISQTACTSTQIPPYEAQYTTRLKGIKITGTKKFKAIGQNHYEIRWEARALWMRLKEWSEFKIVDGQVVPLSYHYTRKGLGSDRPISVIFDWENNMVRGAKGDKAYSYPTELGMQDKLSYQVQMQLDLLKDKDAQQITYNVASYNRAKDYQFDFKRDETLKTKIGSVDTKFYQRVKKDKTISIWVSEDHYYVPMIVEQVEDGGRYKVKIKSWDADDRGTGLPLTWLAKLSNGNDAQPTSMGAANTGIDGVNLDDDEEFGFGEALDSATN